MKPALARASLPSTEAKPAAVRMSGDDRRHQIIQVAIELFSQRGFGGTTTKQIAEAAGVSEAIIFRHFATKHDLYNAILDYKFQQAGEDHWEEIQELAERSEDEKLFRSIAAHILQSFQTDPAFQRLMIYSALEGHEFSRMLHSRRYPFHAFLTDYIRKRQNEGALRTLDPDLVLYGFIGMTAHFGLFTKVFGFDVVGPSDDETVATFTQILLDGIRTNAAGAKAKEGSRKSKT
jgi:TetR/AcrR family transcriptional regulator